MAHWGSCFFARQRIHGRRDMTEEPLESLGVGEGCPPDQGLNIRLTTNLIVGLGSTASKQEWERKK